MHLPPPPLCLDVRSRRPAVISPPKISCTVLTALKSFCQYKLYPSLPPSPPPLWYRYISVPLLTAERAWGYAMELKDSGDRRKKVHLVRRIVKAAYWGSELARLAEERCDERTALEAQAYSLWLSGSAAVEKSAWEVALSKLVPAQYAHYFLVPWKFTNPILLLCRLLEFRIRNRCYPVPCPADFCLQSCYPQQMYSKRGRRREILQACMRPLFWVCFVMVCRSSHQACFFGCRQEPSGEALGGGWL